MALTVHIKMIDNTVTQFVVDDPSATNESVIRAIFRCPRYVVSAPQMTRSVDDTTGYIINTSNIAWLSIDSNPVAPDGPEEPEDLEPEPPEGDEGELFLLTNKRATQ